MKARLGMQAKAYRNTGTYGSPTWVEMINIRDATLTDTMAEADVTRRASAGNRETVPTIREISYEYEAVNMDPESDTPTPAEVAELNAVLAAYNGRTKLDLAIMDGDITTVGSRGVRARFNVFKADRGEELENAQSLAFLFKPAPDANPAAVMLIEA